MNAITWPHSQTTGLVMDTLRKVFQGQLWISVQQPLALRTVPDSEPQPDVACIAGPLRGTAAHPTTAALVVEVADSTLFYDITTKAELYATAGVPDYWVVDINGRQLHVFRDPVELPQGLGAFAYRDRTVLNDADTISPHAMPSATIRVADLLP